MSNDAFTNLRDAMREDAKKPEVPVQSEALRRFCDGVREAREERERGRKEEPDA